jgi:predicted RecB family nuclease
MSSTMLSASLPFVEAFTWRDTNPSEATSIEWYDRWVNTKDRDVKERILVYNEDDCVATRVLLHCIRAIANG